MNKEYYQLGKNVTMFYDPTQSKTENEKLLAGQVKHLDDTKNVQNGFKSGAIFRVPAPKEEVETPKPEKK